MSRPLQPTVSRPAQGLLEDASWTASRKSSWLSFRPVTMTCDAQDGYRQSDMPIWFAVKLIAKSTCKKVASSFPMGGRNPIENVGTSPPNPRNGQKMLVSSHQILLLRTVDSTIVTDRHYSANANLTTCVTAAERYSTISLVNCTHSRHGATGAPRGYVFHCGTRGAGIVWRLIARPSPFRSAKFIALVVGKEGADTL